jgi:hypothetical protein
MNSGQFNRGKNFDVIHSATKTPKHKDKNTHNPFVSGV